MCNLAANLAAADFWEGAKIMATTAKANKPNAVISIIFISIVEKGQQPRYRLNKGILGKRPIIQQTLNDAPCHAPKHNIAHQFYFATKNKEIAH
jgi:hypothetical protein